MYEIAPKYYSIKKVIRELIDNKTISVNAPIPSEHKIMELYKVSRTTVRKAIDDLVSEGYLYKVQGKGTFVKSAEFTQDLFKINSCTEDIIKMGMTPSKKVIHSDVIKADEVRSSRLQIEKGDELLCLERIYYADNEPINYTTTYIPLKVFPLIDKYDFSKESVYDVIENKYNVKIKHAVRTLEAVQADKTVSKYLEVKEKMPILLFRAITYAVVNDKEMPIENFKSFYRSEKYKFYIKQIRN